MRWPVIIFSRITSLGREWDVFSLASLPKNPEKYADKDTPYAFLLPSLVADIRVVCSDSSATYSAALSAARFLRLVRGLPLSEMQVECCGRVYTVTVERDGKCYIAISKFTVSEEDTVTLFGCDIRVRSVKTPYGFVRVAKTLSVSDFSESVLRALTLSKSGENIIGAVCYQFSEGYATALCHFSRAENLSKIVVAAVSAASCVYGCYTAPITVKIAGEEFFFLCKDGEVLISDRQPHPLTLYAPDIN